MPPTKGKRKAKTDPKVTVTDAPPPIEPIESNGGDPTALVNDVETNTPLVTETPKLDNSNGGKDDDSQPTKKRRRRRMSNKLTPDEAAKMEADKLIASTLVDMQVGICCKIGGDVFEAEKAERDALVGAWTRFLGRMQELPWWVELALAQGMYFGPRIVMIRMLAAEQAKSKPKPVNDPVKTVNTSGALVGGLDPIPSKGN